MGLAAERGCPQGPEPSSHLQSMYTVHFPEVCVCVEVSKEVRDVIHRTCTTGIYLLICLEIYCVANDGVECLVLLSPLLKAGIT